MTPDQFEDVVSNLLRVKRTGKPYYYFALPKGDDGEPVLLVQRKEGPLKKAAKLARKQAKVKISARGHVEFTSDKALRFVLDEGSLQPEKLRKLLALKLAKDDGLKKVGRLLRKAEVLTAEEYQQQLDSGQITVEEAAPDSDFEALYSEAEELMDLVKSILGSHETFGPRVGQQLVFLHRAADLAESDPDKATAMVQKVLKAGPAMLSSAWDVESVGVKQQFGEARTTLGESLGTESEAFAKAFGPLEALQKEAVGHKKAKKWKLALEVLSDLSSQLDDLVVPEVEDDDDSLLDDEIEGWGDLSELDDTEPLEDFSEVSTEELARISSAAEADLVLRKASRNARQGLEAFLQALAADEPLMAQLGIQPSDLAPLHDLLPDFDALLDALHETLRSQGDAKAYKDAVNEASTAFDALDADVRLKAFETTDLGSFEIATPLEEARKACSTLLT